MAMRRSALYALLLAAAGCGVPPPPPAATLAPKPETAKPAETTTTPNATESTDPAKLGLKITDTKVGTGDAAEPGDTCYMLYTGRLKSNGKVFDSSAKNGNKPFSFQLGAGQVIKGWDLGVKGMKTGGERTLDIPAELAYGSEDKGDIPPNSELVFDIQLLGLVKKRDENVVLRRIDKPGTGPAIKDGDVVSIQYVGKLVDGTEFDSTAKHGGKPVQVKIGAGALKLPGLDAGLVGLRKGAVATITVPPSLGFGPMEQGGVPANALLKFDVTVVAVN